MLFLIIMAVLIVAFLIGLLIQEWWLPIVSFFGAIAAILFFGITIVQPGYVMYKKTFGTLSYEIFEAGMHFVSPLAVTRSVSIQRRSLDYTGDSTAEALTSDRVAMLVDTTIPYILNDHAAPLMEEHYGTSWNIIGPISRSVIRSCTSTVPWEVAVSDEGRTNIAECISNRMLVSVAVELEQAGFSQEQAVNSFSFPTAIIRRVVPKQPRILAAIAQEQASLIDLRRQQTLTNIAEEEANRRENEGTGIAKMMVALPTKFSVAEMAAMIHANAAKTSAEAFLNAVENGNPNITIVTGSSIPAAVSAN